MEKERWGSAPSPPPPRGGRKGRRLHSIGANCRKESCKFVDIVSSVPFSVSVERVSLWPRGSRDRSASCSTHTIELHTAIEIPPGMKRGEMVTPPECVKFVAAAARFRDRQAPPRRMDSSSRWLFFGSLYLPLPYSSQLCPLPKITFFRTLGWK